MRNILLILTFISSISFAQTGINYQGAATDAQGNKLENQSISLKTSILQGGIEGSASYSETHNTTTDQFGLFNVVIGLGDVLTGSFDSIQWGADAHYLKVELDATGGTDYNLVSTTQMMSVPYAKYAENAGLDSITIANMFLDDISFSDKIIFINPVKIVDFNQTILPSYQIDLNQYLNEDVSHIILNSEFLSTTNYQGGFDLNITATNNNIETPILKVKNLDAGGSNSSSGFTRLFVDKQALVPINSGILELDVEHYTNMAVGSNWNFGEINIVGYIIKENDSDNISNGNNSDSEIDLNSTSFYVECVDMGVSPLCDITLNADFDLSSLQDENFNYNISHQGNPENQFLNNLPSWIKFKLIGIDLNSDDKLFFKSTKTNFYLQETFYDVINTPFYPEVDSNGDVYFYVYTYSNIWSNDCLDYTFGPNSFCISNQNSGGSIIHNCIEILYEKNNTLLSTGIILNFNIQ